LIYNNRCVTSVIKNVKLGKLVSNARYLHRSFINSGKEPILIFEQRGKHRHKADGSLYQLLLTYSKK